jgi:hypothetical protein
MVRVLSVIAIVSSFLGSVVMRSLDGVEGSSSYVRTVATLAMLLCAAL